MKRISIIIALSALLAACVSDPTGEPTKELHPTSKVVNPNVTPSKGSLLVKLNEAADSAILSEIAGIEVDIKPIFQSTKHTSTSSIDNWYLLSFDESIDVQGVAERIAAHSSVRKVEYNVVFEQPNQTCSELR